MENTSLTPRPVNQSDQSDSDILTLEDIWPFRVAGTEKKNGGRKSSIPRILTNTHEEFEMARHT